MGLLAFGCGLVGCGGGSGAAKGSKAAARERAIASARLTRGVFAIAGIGRKITRATDINRPRLRYIAAAIRRTRDAQPDFDAGTGLYFVTQTDLDGSGHQDLFADVSHRVPGGAFVWQAPVWANGQKNSYPASIHTDYQLNAGVFSGERGSIDFVADDATGDNGTMHIVMTTRQNERVVADFTIVNGIARAKDRCALPDGTTWDEVDEPQPGGGMICTLEFPDGSTETITMTPDGDSTEKLVGPDGSVEATGTLGQDGTDNLVFDDGSQEQVDVDTADAGDGGGSGDSGGSDSARLARTPRRSAK